MLRQNENDLLSHKNVSSSPIGCCKPFCKGIGLKPHLMICWYHICELGCWPHQMITFCKSSELQINTAAAAAILELHCIGCFFKTPNIFFLEMEFERKYLINTNTNTFTTQITAASKLFSFFRDQMRIWSEILNQIQNANICGYCLKSQNIFIGLRYTWGPIYGSDLCPWCFVKFIDLTLVDEDINPIPTDEAKRAILGNMAMQVAPLDDQICN